MLNISLFAGGSIHRDDECFSDVSRGRQCAFMSLLTLLHEQVFLVQVWTSRTVDDTVILL